MLTFPGKPKITFMRKATTLLCSFYYSICKGQNKELDSLNSLLQKDLSDSLRAYVLNALIHGNYGTREASVLFTFKTYRLAMFAEKYF